MLKRIRPSNLILIAATPFIIYLFVNSTNYRRSLVAIVGIEQNAAVLFFGFVVLLVTLGTGCLASVLLLTRPRSDDKWRHLANGSIVLHLLLLIGVSQALIGIAPFIDSVVANSVDPFNSELIEKAVRPRRLTADSHALVMQLFGRFSTIYAVVAAVLVIASVPRWGAMVTIRRPALKALMVLNGLGVFYLLFVAHAGFAAGLFVTLRATVFAYLAAAALGLTWAGMQSLEVKRRTVPTFIALAAALAAACLYFALQPRATYSLIGSLDGRVAIVKGTPQGLVDRIRFGDYDGATHFDVEIRSAPTVADALKTMAERDSVSGAFVPSAAVEAGEDIIWEVSFLPDSQKFPAIAFGVLAGFLALLVVGTMHHGVHPLAIAAEFFIDTIRGIPMLVIILYIGLPLSGAVKNATGGVIDFPNITRGIIAISIAYSAFMAEIFRAGILSVPRGQVEAARSLGLSRWKVARLVILPQALTVVIPPLGNEFIAMLKDTSLLSILSVRDVTQRMREFQAASFLPFAPFNSAAILYVLLTLAAASFLKSIERHYDKKSR